MEQGDVGCSICMASIGRMVGTLDCCQHAFCFTCIKQWLDSCSKCPVCKRNAKQLYRHELSRTVSGQAKDGCSFHAYVQAAAPYEELLEIQERVLSPEEPDPQGIPDPGHSEVCEGAVPPGCKQNRQRRLHEMLSASVCDMTFLLRAPKAPAPRFTSSTLARRQHSHQLVSIKVCKRLGCACY
jgi:Ring finger domain